MNSDQHPYEVAYQREKQARINAEKLLDEKTREVYSSIQLIEHQFHELEEQKKELELLFTVARFTQEQLSFKQCLQHFITVLGDISHAHHIHVYLLSKDENSLYSSSIRWPKESFPQAVSDLVCDTDYMNGISLPGYVFEHREATIFEQNHPAIIPERKAVMEQLELKYYALIPILRNDKVVAVVEAGLNLQSRLNTKLFTNCQTAAIQLGVALERRLAQKQMEINLRKIQRVNKQLKDAQSLLVRQEKLASIGQLAAGVAHEINNPVGFCLSNLSMLEEYRIPLSDLLHLNIKLADAVSSKNTSDVEAQLSQLHKLASTNDLCFLAEELGDLIQDSVDGMNRVKDIVANLKSFARMEDGEKILCDINSCIENTLKIIWNEIRFSTQINKNLTSSMPAVLANTNQLSQVLMNIFINASQTCEDGVIIDITTQVGKNNIKIIIQDNGPGIPQDILDKIFDPFFTTKAVGIGTGLGLSISYGIIEQHQGKIDVKSELGKGACFTIYLPIAQKSSKQKN